MYDKNPKIKSNIQYIYTSWLSNILKVPNVKLTKSSGDSTPTLVSCQYE